jgi:hypothetical protein
MQRLTATPLRGQTTPKPATGTRATVPLPTPTPLRAPTTPKPTGARTPAPALDVGPTRGAIRPSLSTASTAGAGASNVTMRRASITATGPVTPARAGAAPIAAAGIPIIAPLQTTTPVGSRTVVPLATALPPAPQQQASQAAVPLAVHIPPPTPTSLASPAPGFQYSAPTPAGSSSGVTGGADAITVVCRIRPLTDESVAGNSIVAGVRPYGVLTGEGMVQVRHNYRKV